MNYKITDWKWEGRGKGEQRIIALPVISIASRKQTNKQRFYVSYHMIYVLSVSFW